MPALLKLTVLFIWLVGVPVLSGILPCLILPAEKRTFARLCITGFLVHFFLFEVTGIPVLLFTWLGDFALLSLVFEALCALLLFGAVFVMVKKRDGFVPDAKIWKKPETEPTALILTAAFAGLLFFVLYMSYTRASFDGDDAYYVTQSVLTWQTETMYRYLPYTGITTEVDFRHALAMFPMWIAHAARASQTHPTIVAHSFIPLVFIPLTLLVYLEIARALFSAQNRTMLSDRRLSAFMVIVMTLILFGNTSIYTPETFLLTRTWQGKSLLANFVLPCGMLALLWMAQAREKEERRFVSVFLFLLAGASGLFTSMAPALLIALVCAGSLAVMGVRWKETGEKNVRVLWEMILPLLPAAIYLILFFVLR